MLNWIVMNVRKTVVIGLASALAMALLVGCGTVEMAEHEYPLADGHGDGAYCIASILDDDCKEESGILYRDTPEQYAHYEAVPKPGACEENVCIAEDKYSGDDEGVSGAEVYIEKHPDEGSVETEFNTTGSSVESVYYFGSDSLSVMGIVSNYLRFLPIYMFQSVPSMREWGGNQQDKRIIEVDASRLTLHRIYASFPGHDFDAIASNFSRTMRENGFERIRYMNSNLDINSEPTEYCIVYSRMSVEIIEIAALDMYGYHVEPNIIQVHNNNNVYVSIEHSPLILYGFQTRSAVIHRFAFIGELNLDKSPVAALMEYGRRAFDLQAEIHNYVRWFPSASPFGQLFPTPSTIVVEHDRFDGSYSNASQIHTFVMNAEGHDAQQVRNLTGEFSRLMYFTPLVRTYDDRIERTLNASNKNLGYFYKLIYRAVYKIEDVQGFIGNRSLSLDIISTPQQQYIFLLREIYEWGRNGLLVPLNSE